MESNGIIEAHLKDCTDCNVYLGGIKKTNIKLPNKDDETFRYIKIANGTIFINDEAIDFSYPPKDFSLDKFSLKDNQYFIII